MALAKFMARQLSKPSGLIGSLILAPLWNKRNAALNGVAFENLALQPYDRVLEVGFGGGYLLGRMAGVVTQGFLAGVDVSPTMVAFCERRYHLLVENGKLELKCAPAESLPYPSASFTKVCTVNSIFYWQNTQQALAEFWRILAQDGLLVMCFTCKTSLENRSFTRYGLTLYDTSEVEQLVAGCGFQKIRTLSSSDKHREFICLVAKK